LFYCNEKTKLALFQGRVKTRGTTFVANQISRSSEGEGLPAYNGSKPAQPTRKFFRLAANRCISDSQPAKLHHPWLSVRLSWPTYPTHRI